MFDPCHDRRPVDAGPWRDQLHASSRRSSTSIISCGAPHDGAARIESVSVLTRDTPRFAGSLSSLEGSSVPRRLIYTDQVSCHRSVARVIRDSAAPFPRVAHNTPLGRRIAPGARHHENVTAVPDGQLPAASSVPAGAPKHSVQRLNAATRNPDLARSCRGPSSGKSAHRAISMLPAFRCRRHHGASGRDCPTPLQLEASLRDAAPAARASRVEERWTSRLELARSRGRAGPGNNPRARIARARPAQHSPSH